MDTDRYTPFICKHALINPAYLHNHIGLHPCVVFIRECTFLIRLHRFPRLDSPAVGNALRLLYANRRYNILCR